jgi:hypothetical protein
MQVTPPFRSRRSAASNHITVLEEFVWLFTKGDQSVRITRSLLGDRTWRLLVEGPADAQEVRSFAEMAACIDGQSGIEQRLRALGFYLDRTSNRRTQKGGTIGSAK